MDENQKPQENVTRESKKKMPKWRDIFHAAALERMKRYQEEQSSKGYISDSEEDPFSSDSDYEPQKLEETQHA